MKRGLLIAGGTLGGLGAVMSITPPQFSATDSLSMAVPVLKKQTLAVQSANIQGASGASYTSCGWFKSLQGVLSQAGL